MMDTQLPETCREVEINILRGSVQLVGCIWKNEYTAMHGQQNIKLYNFNVYINKQFIK